MRRAAAASLLVCVLGAGGAGAQSAAYAVKGPVTFTAQKQPYRGVDAFPRIASADGAAPDKIAKISASMERLDRSIASVARQCAADLRASPAPPSKGPAWTRTITVTMAGPRFVSFMVADDYYCGGAYPDTVTFPMVYDLTTGMPVNWASFLPKDATYGLSNTADGSRAGVVYWPAIAKQAAAAADSECRDVLSQTDPLTLVPSLDAKSGALVFTVFDLPHAVAVCAGSVSLNAAEMRQRGVSADLTAALAQARGLQR